MKIFSRLMKSRRDSLVLSVRLTRRTATVTISAPEAAWARAISWKLRYLPVPTIRRDLKARPAITRSSDIGVSTKILDLAASCDKSETVEQSGEPRRWPRREKPFE